MASIVPNVSLKVLIVGGGPAGLCAAAALRQDGHRVTVLERHGGLQTQGNALVIQPAAVKALEYLKGAHEALEKVSVRSDKLRYWSYKGTQPFATTNLTDKRFETDRPSTQRVFFSLATQIGVKVVFGRNATRVTDDGNKASLSTDVGEEYEADLIIAADGIKSRVRKALFPDRSTDPIVTRESIFLAEIPTESLHGNETLAPWLEPGTTHGTLGPGRFILSRYLTRGMYGVQFIDVDHSEPGEVDGNWNTQADMTVLRSLFSDYNPITREALHQIRVAQRWQIAYGPRLDTWRSKHGRIVLLGDAAHAMIPHAAQGLSQGIEDGISLARMLQGGREGCEEITAITEAWEGLRKPRAELFVQRSLNNATLRSLPDGQAQMARDEHIIKSSHATPQDVADVEMDMAANQNSPQFMKWVREYDVVKEAQKALGVV